MGRTCTGLRTQVFHVFDKRISCHQLKSASGLHNAETKLHHSIHLIIIQNTEAGATEHYLQYLQLLTQSLILSSQCDSQEKQTSLTSSQPQARRGVGPTQQLRTESQKPTPRPLWFRVFQSGHLRYLSKCRFLGSTPKIYLTLEAGHRFCFKKLPK